jgi:tetratricopeptide (TPR) repeat protein
MLSFVSASQDPFENGSWSSRIIFAIMLGHLEKRAMTLRTGIIFGAVFLFLAGCATEKPVERAPLPQETAQTYFNRGVESSEKGDFREAISNFNKAIDVNPEFVVAYLNRGYSYSRRGEFDKAIADYTKAIELNPRYAVAYHNRGFVYRRMGEYDRAILDFTKSIEIDPKYASAYYYRGHIYHYKGEYEKAWEDIKKARNLGYKVPAEFYKNLRDAYEKQKGISPN